MHDVEFYVVTLKRDFRTSRLFFCSHWHTGFLFLGLLYLKQLVVVIYLNFLIRQRCLSLLEQLLPVVSFWSQMVSVLIISVHFIFWELFYLYLRIVLGPGLFPNHIPNPEDKEAMRAITQAVLNNKADLGIIFDTDVDRS